MDLARGQGQERGLGGVARSLRRGPPLQRGERPQRPLRRGEGDGCRQQGQHRERGDTRGRAAARREGQAQHHERRAEGQEPAPRAGEEDTEGEQRGQRDHHECRPSEERRRAHRRQQAVDQHGRREVRALRACGGAARRPDPVGPVPETVEERVRTEDAHAFDHGQRRHHRAGLGEGQGAAARRLPRRGRDRQGHHRRRRHSQDELGGEDAVHGGHRRGDCARGHVCPEQADGQGRTAEDQAQAITAGKQHHRRRRGRDQLQQRELQAEDGSEGRRGSKGSTSSSVEARPRRGCGSMPAPHLVVDLLVGLHGLAARALPGEARGPRETLRAQRARAAPSSVARACRPSASAFSSRGRPAAPRPPRSPASEDEREVSTGVPQAMASTTGRPKPSYRLG